MRKFLIIAAFGLAATLAADSVFAQVRLPNRVPRIKVPPVVMVIPPSAALTAAMRTAPGAKALGVQLRGNMYIVKLKQGNTVLQRRIIAGNGMILP